MEAQLTPVGGFSDNSQAMLEDAPKSASKNNENEALYNRETLELIRAFNRITDPKQRRKIFELIKTMADE